MINSTYPANGARIWPDDRYRVSLWRYWDVRHHRSGGLVVAAWGQHGKLHGRAASVRSTLDAWKIPVFALKLNKDGSPAHPLYLRDDTRPFLIDSGG